MDIKTNSDKPLWKKWWFWVIAVFAVFALIGSSGGERQDTKEGVQLEQDAQLEEEVQLEGVAQFEQESQFEQEVRPEPEVQPEHGIKSEPEINEGEQEATWQKVKSWSGSSSKNTEPFEIIGDYWRINWACLQDGFLGIMVYGATDRTLEEIAVSTTDSGSDTSYVYKNGLFYLSVVGGPWEIEIEELR